MKTEIHIFYTDCKLRMNLYFGVCMRHTATHTNFLYIHRTIHIQKRSQQRVVCSKIILKTIMKLND